MRQGAVDPEKPIFHVSPVRGWTNDPNGPFHHRGKYHMFYQHLNQGCEWTFGLVWGHSVSSDLVHWERLPDALVPGPGILDADGCFSGCALVDTDGTPTILYTGVRLRSNPNAGPLPPPEFDLQLPFIESQIAAIADPDDEDLVHWRKDDGPFLSLPPPNLELTGWRDPFILERPSPANSQEWVVLVGSGLKNVGGTCVVYRTPRLRDGTAWRYDGLLCQGDGDTGAVWECPLVAALKPLPPPVHGLPSHTLGLSSRGAHSHSHRQLMAVAEEGHTCFDDAAAVAAVGSAVRRRSLGSKPAPARIGEDEVSASYAPPIDDRYSHFYTISPDACTNPTIYWLGRYKSGRFDLAAAKGPFRLDLGDVLYAPNIMEDTQGRMVLWGWLQERRSVGTYDYAGCLSLPRLMWLDYDKLYMEPVPELTSLRSGEAWHISDVLLAPEQPMPLPSVGGPFLDVDLTVRQGSAGTVGVLLRSWNAGGEGGAALLYNWESQTLEVVFEALDPATMAFSLTAPGARHIGGPLDHKPGQPLQLRLMLDGSVLEVYTGSGEVLSTRLYRGQPHPGSDAGIEFVALDGTATLARVAAYEMSHAYKAEAAAAMDAAAAAATAAAAAAGGILSPRMPGSLVGSPVPDSVLQKALQTSLSTGSLGLSRTPSQLGFGAGTPKSQGGGGAALEGLEGLLGGLHLGPDGQLPPEEEMTADIFMEVLAL